MNDEHGRSHDDERDQIYRLREFLLHAEREREQRNGERPAAHTHSRYHSARGTRQDKPNRLHPVTILIPAPIMTA